MNQQNKWFASTEIANAVICNNGYNVITPWSGATGFKTNAVKYAHTASSSLAEEYLLNSQLNPFDPETETSIEIYLDDFNLKMISTLGEEDCDQSKLTPLSDGAPLDMVLGEAIARRRSIRYYTGDPIPFNYVATLLRAANGVSSVAEANLAIGGEAKLHFRTVPSGGGLYPVDVYMLAIKVDGLVQGVYRYLSKQDQLFSVGSAEKISEIQQAFTGASELIKKANPSLVFILVARPWRTLRKYGDMGLKFILHEVGGITQNLHLACTGLGLGSVDCASFFSGGLHESLNIDGLYQTALHAVLVGYP